MNEGAHIGLTSISKLCIICLPYTDVSIKHNFWDRIQFWRAWRWATSIMHDLCGIRLSNYGSFH